MFESDDPTNLEGHRPKAFMSTAKYNQTPHGDFRGYLQANPNTILRYNISNYNEGHGEIRQSTVEAPSFADQVYMPTPWLGIPTGNLDFIRKEKQRLIDKQAQTTPEHRAALGAQKQWSNSVIVLLMGALIIFMYAIYAV